MSATFEYTVKIPINGTIKGYLNYVISAATPDEAKICLSNDIKDDFAGFIKGLLEVVSQSNLSCSGLELQEDNTGELLSMDKWEVTKKDE